MITLNFLDSNESSCNSLDLVTSSIHFFATYLAEGIFDIPISFCLVLILYPTKQQFSQGKLLWEESLRSKSLCLLLSWQITLAILFFVPATN